MNEQLKKLGLRIRPRTVEPRAAEARPEARRERPGQITFDDRGNAIFAWNESLADDGEDGERARTRALEHPGLSMMDEEPPANTPIRSNPGGLRLGYNPYESGMLAKKERKKKRDLRELSKWLEMKRKLAK